MSKKDHSGQSLGESKVITLDNGTKIEVKKLFLGDYLIVFRALEKFPQLLDLGAKQNPDQFLLQLPNLLANFFDEVIGILALAVKMDEEFLKTNIDLEKALDLCLAIIDVNNFFGVAQKLKKRLPGFFPDNIFGELIQLGQQAKQTSGSSG